MVNGILKVKNFGPIKEADLDLRRVTVLIGEQASGKSVLAKLAAVFNDLFLDGWHLEEKWEFYNMRGTSKKR